MIEKGLAIPKPASKPVHRQTDQHHKAPKVLKHGGKILHCSSIKSNSEAINKYSKLINGLTNQNSPLPWHIIGITNKR